jgi:hypothetical protein
MNLETLCNALGASPDEIRKSIPTISWRIDRETTPQVRAQIVSMAINEWGLEVDEEQQRDEFALNAPRPGSKPLKGKAQPGEQPPQSMEESPQSSDDTEEGPSEDDFRLEAYGSPPEEGSIDIEPNS